MQLKTVSCRLAPSLPKPATVRLLPSRKTNRFSWLICRNLYLLHTQAQPSIQSTR